MADPIANRFFSRFKKRQLDDNNNRIRTNDDIQAEEDLIKSTPKVEPIKADKSVDRNAPCPCGSGKKYKKCCGMKQ